MEIIKIITSGLIAVVGNIIFYWIIKSKIDKSIEKYKIAYAGIFKEKIEIYRKLLAMIYGLQYKLTQCVNNISDDDFKCIKEKFNTFIDFYLINQPFLSILLLEKLNVLKEEYQQCFEDSYVGQTKQKSLDTIIEGTLQQFKSRNKLLTDYFKSAQEDIVIEMRNDMQIGNKKMKTSFPPNSKNKTT